MVVIGISKITDHLLPTEEVLWQGKPEPKAYSIGVVKFIPILIGAIFLIWSLVNLLLSSTPWINFFLPLVEPFVQFLITLAGLGLIGLGLLNIFIRAPKTKSIEYLITNQRVFIYSSTQGKDPKIINLSEVNEHIEMKYNKSHSTGSIYIPTPQWLQFSPDIWGIKEPYKVYNILVEAIETGKRTNWK
jgi:fumarate reductase subunit C